jgi:hypothetical protein
MQTLKAAITNHVDPDNHVILRDDFLQDYRDYRIDMIYKIHLLGQAEADS